MARKIRVKSPTGYYHVMTRGNNKQLIFKNDKDRIKYLCCIKDAQEKFYLKVICYCLMPNHTHLILFDENFVLSNFMKCLNSKYAAYFNREHNRIGSLFQDRFKDECIRNERQLLAAYRYVLNNPYKAGMCEPWDYKWSSYSCYLRESKIVDSSVISCILGDREQHKTFIKSFSDDHFLDI